MLAARDLALALCRVAAYVQQVEFHGAALHRYADWWQHDGLHFYRAEIRVHDLFELVKSPQSLLYAMPGDEYVRVGVAPQSNAWYLRFYLSWDNSGFELLGDFDLTVPVAQVEGFRKQMAALKLLLHEQDATQYYKEIRPQHS
jgi:hypothetical protein